MQTYFDQLIAFAFAGPITDNPLAFRHYNPDEIVLGNAWQIICVLPPVIGIISAGMARTCLAPVRLSVPWQAAGDALEMAKRKADVAFEFFTSSTRAVLLLPRCRRLARRRVAEKNIAQFRAVMTEVLGETAANRRETAGWAPPTVYLNSRYGAGRRPTPIRRWFCPGGQCR